MADRKRAAEERMQVAAQCARGYRPIGQAKVSELPPRDDAVLPVRKRSDRVIYVSGALFALHRCIRRTGIRLSPLNRAGGRCWRGVAVAAVGLDRRLQLTCGEAAYCLAVDRIAVEGYAEDAA